MLISGGSTGLTGHAILVSVPPVPELLHSLGCVTLPCLPQDDEANGAPDQISARIIMRSCDLLRINTCPMLTDWASVRPILRLRRREITHDLRREMDGPSAVTPCG